MPEDDAAGEAGEQTPEPTTDPTVLDRLAALEAENAGLRRRETFSAHVPAEVLATPVGQLFAQTYTGEMTAEAITARATELGLIEAPAAGDGGTTATAEEQAAFQQAEGLRHGSAPAIADRGPDPREQANEAALAARKGGTRDDAIGAFVESMMISAASGDTRATRQPAREYFAGARG